MSDYAQLARDLIADAIGNQMPGLNASVVLHYLVSQGDYDADAGAYANVWADSDPIPCVAARPTFEEVQGGKVIATDVKLIIPAKFLTREIDEQTTATISGKKYNVWKQKGVPGVVIEIVFARLC
jgi:hypothetical protein